MSTLYKFKFISCVIVTKISWQCLSTVITCWYLSTWLYQIKVVKKLCLMLLELYEESARQLELSSLYSTLQSDTLTERKYLPPGEIDRKPAVKTVDLKWDVQFPTTILIFCQKIVSLELTKSSIKINVYYQLQGLPPPPLPYKLKC